MAYTIEQLGADCNAALKELGNNAEGREKMRGFISKACLDDDFVATHFGPNQEERKVIYEDPDFGFCILAHVYIGAKKSNPHDHGEQWAIYSQVEGETEMTDWKCVEKPANGNPGKVEKVKSYVMKRGDAYVYNEGFLHSPKREATTRLLRVEGKNLAGTKRDAYEVAA
jgi:hypothetical protein